MEIKWSSSFSRIPDARSKTNPKDTGAERDMRSASNQRTRYLAGRMAGNAVNDTGIAEGMPGEPRAWPENGEQA